MKSKLTKEIVNQRIADRGIELIGEYVNYTAKVSFRCAQGHIWEASPGKILWGRNCPTCSLTKKRASEVDVRARMAEQGIELVGNYINDKTKTSVRCQQGHLWETTPHTVWHSKKGCPKCYKESRVRKVDEINSDLRSRKIKIVGGYSMRHSPAVFECEFGHRWETVVDNVLKGTGCNVCHPVGGPKLPLEEVSARLAQRGYRVIGDYINTNTRTELECSEGHIWSIKVNDVLKGSGCPSCAVYGFKPERPAELYYAEVLTEKGDVAYMIGITNYSFEDRYSEADRQNMNLLLRRRFQLGADAQELERAVKIKNAEYLLRGDKTMLRQKGSLTESTEIFTKDVLCQLRGLNGNN